MHNVHLYVMYYSRYVTIYYKTNHEESMTFQNQGLFDKYPVMIRISKKQPVN